MVGADLVECRYCKSINYYARGNLGFHCLCFCDPLPYDGLVLEVG